MRNLLVAVLVQTFTEKVGKHQVRMPPEAGQAMLTSFDLHIDYIPIARSGTPHRAAAHPQPGRKS